MTASLEKKLDNEIASLLKELTVRDGLLEYRENITFDEFLDDRMLMIMAIRRGIPFSLFELIKNMTPFTENEWAMLLDISTKSLQRYKKSGTHTFKASHSEKIIQVAEVNRVGIEVFGNIDKLKSWMSTPNFTMGKLKPIELIMNSYGKEMVISELSLINHGILV